MTNDIFDLSGLNGSFKDPYDFAPEDIMTLQEWLEETKVNSGLYADAAERLVKAIGEPQIINLDANPDHDLAKVYPGKHSISLYKTFDKFYGIEDTIEELVNHFRHAAGGGESKRQVLCMMGPPGSAKSTIADRFKYLMEKEYIYVLAAEVTTTDRAGNTETKLEVSPIFEPPTGLFNREQHGDVLFKQYGIPPYKLTGIYSGWAIKRLREDLNNDISNFKVVRMKPSVLNQISIGQCAAGDENTDDSSKIVGSIDVGKAARLGDDDPDAFLYTGVLNKGNQGISELIEMLKMKDDVLYSLLEATQSHRYFPNEGSVLPFTGLIISHTNEGEWAEFLNSKVNEAMGNRIKMIRVPYNMRESQEMRIHDKMLQDGALGQLTRIPGTLKALARYGVMSRMSPSNMDMAIKMRIYDGDTKAAMEVSSSESRSLKELKAEAGPNESMSGIGTRDLQKLFEDTSVVHESETGDNTVDPFTLIQVIAKHLVKNPPADKEQLENVLEIVKEMAMDEFDKDLHEGMLADFDRFGQNEFVTYHRLCEWWVNYQGTDERFSDADITGVGIEIDVAKVNKRLSEFEKPAGINNPAEFRAQLALFVAGRGGPDKVSWKDHVGLHDAIRAKLQLNEAALDDAILSFSNNKDKKGMKAHESFINRMSEKGYTPDVLKRMVLTLQAYKHNH